MFHGIQYPDFLEFCAVGPTIISKKDSEVFDGGMRGLAKNALNHKIICAVMVCKKMINDGKGRDLETAEGKAVDHCFQ